MRRLFLILILSVSMISGVAKRVEPYAGSRIFWDMRSQQQVFDDGWYARMIQLNDGRLMAASESGWNVIVSYSNDSGRTWSPQETIFYPPEGMRYFDVDLCQLTDDKIIITYNIGFPDEKAPDGRFGVRLRISEDNGQTWSDDIFVYDGEREFENGTWEPNVLELPSGELHLYVSDEAPYTHSGEQCIQLFRSFDRGYNWQGPETISFRKGARDGMPTAVILGDSIVVAIEDNGWPGMESFVPVTVRTSLSDNWRSGVVDGESLKRSQTLDYAYCPQMYGGAPYIRVLPSGETILSRQSYLKSGEYELMNMFVYVGDKDGRGFKAMSQPFPDNLDSRISIEVNSVSVVDSVVYALGGFMSGGTDNRRHVDIVKGYPFKCIRAFKRNTMVDGIKGDIEYNSPDANQIKLGTNSLSHNVYADFNYDDKYLYFIADVDDNTPECEMGETALKDGVRLLIDTDNVSDDTPVKGMYEFFFPRTGSPYCLKGANGKWEDFKTKGMIYRCVTDNDHYVLEAGIPWRLLGKKHAPEHKRMAVTIEVDDLRGDALIIESIPDAKHDESWTWPEFQLTE